MGITYRDIPDYPGYRVGDNGSVWTLWNNKYGLGTVWRYLRPQNKKGKLTVSLRKDGISKHFGTHALVLTAFIGPCPIGMEGRHLDGDYKNNNLWNLKWGTPVENQADRVLHGTSNQGEQHGLSKLTESDIIQIRDSEETLQEIADRFDTTKSNVSMIRNRKVWTHI